MILKWKFPFTNQGLAQPTGSHFTVNWLNSCKRFANYCKLGFWCTMMLGCTPVFELQRVPEVRALPELLPQVSDLTCPERYDADGKKMGLVNANLIKVTATNREDLMFDSYYNQGGVFVSTIQIDDGDNLIVECYYCGSGKTDKRVEIVSQWEVSRCFNVFVNDFLDEDNKCGTSGMFWCR